MLDTVDNQCTQQRFKKCKIMLRANFTNRPDITVQSSKLRTGNLAESVLDVSALCLDHVLMAFLFSCSCPRF